MVFHPKQSGSQQRTAVKCGGHKHPRPAHTRKQPQRSKGGSSISLMAGNRKTTQQYRQNRAALLEGNPDCYWGCGNKATQADHLIEHDAGGDDSTANLVPSCRTCNSKRGAIYVNNKTAQRQAARNQALNGPPKQPQNETPKPNFLGH